MEGVQMDPVFDQALRAVETARRNRRYELMQRFNAAVLAEIKKGTQPQWEVQARLTYELHMAAYQQALAATEPQRKRLLIRSMRLAEQSAQEAIAASDVAGRLFSEMNTSGLLLPALGRVAEALEMSERVSKEAEDFAEEAGTVEEDHRRAWRVAMNCYFHRVRLLIANDGDPARVALLLQKIAANPVYLREYTQAEWAQRDIEAGMEFIKGAD